MSPARDDRSEPARSFFRTPPAWLITVLLFAFAVVTIVLSITGQ